MRLLLDACVPRSLRRFLTDDSVRTAREMGWGTLKNGANDWPAIRAKGGEIATKVAELKPGDFVEMNWI